MVKASGGIFFSGTFASEKKKLEKKKKINAQVMAADPEKKVRKKIRR